jgi:Flp pilus assembly protein TadG
MAGGPVSRKYPRGFSAIYFMIALVALCAFSSLAVDLGRLQLAKTELRQAADAAARYGATGLTDGSWQQRASDAAAQNKVDGSSLLLVASDVTRGNWNAKASPQFSPSRKPFNAVQVSAQRTTANGSPIKLMFASMIGMGSCDARATSIAKVSPLISGFIGLDGFMVKNNLRAAGYDSSTNTSPTWDTRSGDGMIGSNASITAKNNEIVGQVVLGVGATHNLTLSSPAVQLKVSIPTPVVDFSGAPASNPGGVAKNLVVNNSITLPGGTYSFTSVSIANHAEVRFSGPATVYINGSVTFAQDGAIYAYQDLPENLHIRQRGTGTEFGGSSANNVSMIAEIQAPQTTFEVKNNATLMGGAIFKTITVKNNGEFYYDQQLDASLGVGATAVMLVR